MKISFSINDRDFLIKPYNTFIEKELLLASSFEVEDLDQILEILGFQELNDVDLKELSEDEKKVLIYKYREISLGDEIEVKFTCDNCKQVNEGSLEAKDFLIPGKRNDPDIKKIGEPFDESSMPEYTGLSAGELDEMDIDEYEDLIQRVKDNQTSFNFVRESKCLICGHVKSFDVSSSKYIIAIMSDDTLMTLYKTYNFMIYFGHYSKEDIDKMYPFERTIFVGLLNKTKEDLNQ